MSRRNSPVVILPTMHPGQVRIYNDLAKYNAVRCPRRWGKTKMMVTLACDYAAKGRICGLFTPNHKQLQEPYGEIRDILSDITARSSKTDGHIQTIKPHPDDGAPKLGGVDFWYLDDNELAGRGREYDLVMIDEGAFTKDIQMMDIWTKSIRPTMLTRPNARTIVFSTPKGKSPDNFFYQICTNPAYGFKEHHAKILENPKVSADELERYRLDNRPEVYQQEYLAEFVDWSGEPFFARASLLVDGKPIPYPHHCDAVFATIDTGVKTGKNNDGTAVTYWALATHTSPAYPLMVLDWSVDQIEGALLETWLPTVFQHLEHLAKTCQARSGSLGAFIEDKVTGMVLLQQAKRRGWPAHPIDSNLTKLGKDERAISVSGYVYRGMVKVTDVAFDKVTTYKGTSRNHFMTQIEGFHVGVDGINDDILDTFCYGVAIGLGNSEGF